MRGAPFLDLNYPSLWCRLAPRRKLLVLTPMLAHALSSRSWSRAKWPCLHRCRGCRGALTRNATRATKAHLRMAMVVQKADNCGTIIVRGRDHGRLRGCQGSDLPFLLPSQARHGPVSTTSAQARQQVSYRLSVQPRTPLEDKTHRAASHYFIRECVENGKLRVPFVPTKENSADFFTKSLCLVKLSSTFATK